LEYEIIQEEEDPEFKLQNVFNFKRNKNIGPRNKGILKI